MTVVENIAAGALFAGGARTLTEARRPRHRPWPISGLADQFDQPAETLTLARRKRLELAKSLAMRPKLLFLDEVNAGLNPAEIERRFAVDQQGRRQGVTIVVIEHLMKVVAVRLHRLVVLHHGQLIADGSPQAVVSRILLVAEAYLGKRYVQASGGRTR